MHVPFLIGEPAKSPRPVLERLSFKSNTDGTNLSFFFCKGAAFLNEVYLTVFMERKSYLKKKEGATFSERVVAFALAIPEGRVATYGNLSHAAGGGKMAAQSVTAILSKAFDAGERRIPFHRIVYADGRVWLSEKYKQERLRRYLEEGIEVDTEGKIKNFKSLRYEFK